MSKLDITQEKRKYLNLFAGFGGNTKPLDRDRFQVTHVELDPYKLEYLKEYYPEDSIYEDNAYDFNLSHHDEYDIVWASPPCTTHSRANWQFKGYRDFGLYQLIDYYRRNRLGKTWIVENVISRGEPLYEPDALVGRHYIWSNRAILKKTFPPDNIQDQFSMHLDPESKRDGMSFDVAKYIHEEIFSIQSSLEELL